MKKVVISPFSYEGKTYPYWRELIKELKNKGYYIIQLGIKNEEKLDVNEYLFDISLKDIKEKIKDIDFFISIDSFFPHYVNYYLHNLKGFVIFGSSNPDIFGYNNNINIIKSRNYIKSVLTFWPNEKQDNNIWLEPLFISEIIDKNI